MTERVGLFGWPLGHSISPPMHNAAFVALGLDWRYDLFPVPPEKFESKIARLIDEDCRGFNVTIPHKQAAFRLPQVDEITPAAEAIGAVNTLTVKPDGALKADNTDWRAFLHEIKLTDVPLDQVSCVVLGTGGSAKAIVYALQQGGTTNIIQVSRHPNGRKEVISYADLRKLPHHEAYLIVNCTPVGMYPHPDESPWPEDRPIPARSIVYDLVYNPQRTRLMQQAQDAGARAVSGLGMLVMQGAYAFEQWTGQFPPVDVMMDAAKAALYSHSE
jgi:shikimate dehydrogenase